MMSLAIVVSDPEGRSGAMNNEASSVESLNKSHPFANSVAVKAALSAPPDREVVITPLESMVAKSFPAAVLPASGKLVVSWFPNQI